MFVAQQGGSGGGFLPILLIGLIIAAMYFFMIRPQQRQRRQTQEMQGKLGVGDQVITIGGLYGTILETDDESVTLEVAPGVTNKYVRGAVSRVVNPTDADADADEARDKAEDE